MQMAHLDLLCHLDCNMERENTAELQRGRGSIKFSLDAQRENDRTTIL